MFHLFPTLCIETGTIRRKLVASFVWLIVAAITLTAYLLKFIWFSEFSNRLCFLMLPFIPRALTLQSSIYCLCLENRNTSVVASSSLSVDHSHPLY